MRRRHPSRNRRPTALLLSAFLLHPCTSFSPPLSHASRRIARTSAAATALAASASDTVTAHPLQAFYTSLNALYDRTQSTIKCPFIRRRVADALDATAMLLQFLVIRHKSLGLSDRFLDTDDDDAFSFGAPGCKPTGRHIKTTLKSKHLPLSSLASRIQNDWSGASHPSKGYYITGKLDTTIYRDDCLFTGPDPDMPVRGLRKYLSASAQLFDTKSSLATLTDISYSEGMGDKDCGVVQVKWELGGVINLPWHPTVEPWTGWTKYHIDEEGLVYLHEEGWDVEVWRIFLSVLFPTVRWVDVIF
ncbi:hypothetical protein HJC23_007902 [Cyclotella cryptica]|uniref:Uncharacterized protein n=1 Tax=Cyclotella cryptica TaxID=29204 RepID=A0ABD3R476_9STRA|eukprot:CCRYP_000277-RA/>CCRYP_000277-RA protein AED:0.00 eAED:0.00 QI:301/-1/1/1/-1/1/1/302/302